MDDFKSDYILSRGEDFARRYESSSQFGSAYPAASIDVSPISLVKQESNIDTYHSIAGRVMLKRNLGSVSFITLKDDGQEMQLFFKKNILDDYKQIVKSMDLGDVVHVAGRVFKTRTDELTLEVDSYSVLSKSLHPFPDKHKGISDQYTREKSRHLDILINDESREALLVRSQANQAIREYLLSHDFLEVETPILQPIYGGANARPFMTKYHAEGNADAFLRISNELYLKRLVAGGINRVFEFAKDFRNEGIDRTHNPEFTQLELYQAYADYFTMMDHVENIFSVVSDRLGKNTSTFMGYEINLKGDWNRISMLDSLREIGDVNFDLQDRDEVVVAASEFDHTIDSYGRAILTLFEEFVEPKLIQPTIVYDYPIETSPLAKTHRSDPGLVERFEFFIGGKEFGNAYSELNDPLEQRIRFMEQQKLSEVDDEAHPLDEDFLKVMEDGMPPMGGLGIGTDRLAMLFSDRSSIRDVLFYPFKK